VGPKRPTNANNSETHSAYSETTTDNNKMRDECNYDLCARRRAAHVTM